MNKLDTVDGHTASSGHMAHPLNHHTWVLSKISKRRESAILDGGQASERETWLHEFTTHG